VIAPQFDTAFPFSEGIAIIASGEEYGFIDEAGKMIIRPQFAEVEGFTGGISAVLVKGGRWGFIDRTGHVRHPRGVRQRLVSHTRRAHHGEKGRKLVRGTGPFETYVSMDGPVRVHRQERQNRHPAQIRGRARVLWRPGRGQGCQRVGDTNHRKLGPDAAVRQGAGSTGQ
jgi:hypothetical protein